MDGLDYIYIYVLNRLEPTVTRSRAGTSSANLLKCLNDCPGAGFKSTEN